MVLEQELFRQIALQKEELFRLVISNEHIRIKVPPLPFLWAWET